MTGQTKKTAAGLVALAAMLVLAGAPAAGVQDDLAGAAAVGDLEAVGEARTDALYGSVAALQAAWAEVPELAPGAAGPSGCDDAGDATPWHQALQAVCSIRGLAAPPVAIPLSNYEVCDVSGTVCVVQEDGAPSDPTCASGYLASYGPVVAQNGVFVNRGSPDEVSARAYEQCSYYFIATTHYWGVRADAPDLLVLWRETEHEANPACNWNEQHLARTDVLVRSSDFEVRWTESTETDCRSGVAADPVCYTNVRVGTDVEDLGCPLGPPPQPPTPDAFPYGGLLP